MDEQTFISQGLIAFLTEVQSLDASQKVLFTSLLQYLLVQSNTLFNWLIISLQSNWLTWKEGDYLADMALLILDVMESVTVSQQQMDEIVQVKSQILSFL